MRFEGQSPNKAKNPGFRKSQCHLRHRSIDIFLALFRFNITMFEFFKFYLSYIWLSCGAWLVTQFFKLQMSPSEFDRWSKIRRQIEHYFGDDNYPSDKFLNKVAEENSGCTFRCVPLYHQRLCAPRPMYWWRKHRFLN